MNRDILAGVALFAVALVVAGAVLLSESYLKSSPADSTGPETPTAVSPSKIPTTTVAAVPTTSGSSTSSGGVEPTSVSPSEIPTSRPASGSSGGSSLGAVSPTTEFSTGVPTTAVAATRTVSGPPSFTLLVTPVEVRARPGDTIRYTMSIEPKGGFDQPVSLRLDVSALFLYHNSFDLGVVSPPYPTTLEYIFVVPGEVPAGITVKGLLSAEGGGHRDEQALVLIVG